ncbi:MAG: 30S ribosome-binding factor RbfA [Chloroflexi bacterium]|nr:30S ribosome-binding factor RbfA [Chloroflexota bacterium]
MTYRIERVNHLLRQQLSELLQHNIKDPRLSTFVAITEVAISPDLKYAKVYVSHLGSEDEKQNTIQALNAASGYLRKELAKNTRLRRIPELKFEWDTSIERGARVLELLDKVKEKENL